ncbi:MAG: amino terminal protease self-immunity [Planctomycetota bacterium]|nr:amino terminal protease self-immunity [Planctomycetota bacterium]
MPPPPDLDPIVASSILLLVLIVGTSILAAWSWMLVTIALGRPLLPHAPRRVVPWGLISVLAVLLLYLGVQFGTGIIYGMVKWLSAGMQAKRNPQIPLRDLLVVVGISNILTVQLVPVLLRVTSGARLSDLGLTTRDLGKNIARGAVLCVLLLPVIYTTMLLASRVWPPKKHPIELAIRADRSPATLLLTSFSAVVAAPLTEEVLFRGVLLGWLWKVGLGRRSRAGEDLLLLDSDVDPFVDNPESPTAAPKPDPFAGNWRMDWLANVIASVIFAGLHYAQWPAPIPLFLLSLGLGEAYRRTGSLVAPITMHATFNGLSTVAMMLAASAGLPK